MDVACPKCGEPWDIYELHDVDGLTFDQARKRFYRVGCEVFGARHGTANPKASSMMTALVDLLGDDIDGLAAELDDFGAWE